MFLEIIEFLRSIKLQERLFVVGMKSLVFVFVRSRQIQHLLKVEWVLSIQLCISVAHLFDVLALGFIFTYSVLKGYNFAWISNISYII